MTKKHTKIAIVYDFDGTLAEGNIQENSFIPELNIAKDKFWNEVKKLAKENEMDEILAYMFLLLHKAKSEEVRVDKASIKKHGKSVKYYEGVIDFFTRINDYSKTKSIKIEHYIISSGTKEMIEGTSIAKFFQKIYASSFKYDQHDVPEWPALAINYTNKTQYLFRINKGIDNAWDNSKINKYVPDEERPIPFNRMIYLGDGETDIPAMKLLNYQGGISIAVFPPNTRGAKAKTAKLIQHKRATYLAPADYREGKEIDVIIKGIIDMISTRESLMKYSKMSNRTKKR